MVENNKDFNKLIRYINKLKIKEKQKETLMDLVYKFVDSEIEAEKECG